VALKNWHLFAIVAAASLGLQIGTNRILLSEEVLGQILATVGSPAEETDRILREARRWQFLAYGASPLLLFTRITLTALLVQLSLLLLGVQKPLGSIFRGALWAQGATWLGSAAQAAWIALIPISAITTGTLETPPGTLASFLPASLAQAPAWGLLLRQVSLFDLAWITLFATAIEDGTTVTARLSFVAVASTWFAVTAMRWGVLLYFTGMA
jgi:hypothetical protein